jgi:hypothetical protein
VVTGLGSSPSPERKLAEPSRDTLAGQRLRDDLKVLGTAHHERQVLGLSPTPWILRRGLLAFRIHAARVRQAERAINDQAGTR